MLFVSPITDHIINKPPSDEEDEEEEGEGGDTHSLNPDAWEHLNHISLFLRDLVDKIKEENKDCKIIEDFLRRIYLELETQGLIDKGNVERLEEWLLFWTSSLVYSASNLTSDGEESREEDKTIDISFIIASRNDDYGGTPAERLSIAMKQLMFFPWDSLNIEIIITQWNDPYGAPPLSEHQNMGDSFFVLHRSVPLSFCMGASLLLRARTK